MASRTKWSFLTPVVSLLACSSPREAAKEPVAPVPRLVDVAPAKPPTALAVPVPSTPPPPEPPVTEETASESSDPPPTTPFVSRCSGVSLVLVSVAAKQGSVEPVVELRNGGGASVALMNTGDGSTSDMRNPSLKFEILPANLSTVGRCGNVNGLSEEDFVTLPPGGRAKLGWLYVAPPKTAGRYTIRAIYRNDPKSTLLRGLAAPPSQKLVARARATVACELVSNTLTFDWK